MITTQTKPEIFTIFSNEIQGRLDPYFYRVEFRELEEKLKNFNSAVRNLRRNSKRSQKQIRKSKRIEKIRK